MPHSKRNSSGTHWRRLCGAFAGFLATGAVAGNICIGAAHSDPNVFSARRGINLAAPFARVTREGPFTLPNQISAYHGLRRYFSPDVVGQLAAVGVQLVRLPVNPVVLLENSGAARDNLLDELMRAADEFTRTRIAVILDFHFWQPPDRTWTEETVLDGPSGAGFKIFRVIVGELAKRMAARPHGTIALEFLNEPQLCRHGSGDDWLSLQRLLVADVRSISAVLPVVVTGCGGQLDGLTASKDFPFSDPNIIYTFHFYEPFVFTHQSVEKYYPLIRHLPYPASSGSLDEALTNVAAAAEEKGLVGMTGLLAREKAKIKVRRYFSMKTDISFIQRRFDEINSWANRIAVPSNRIFLGEFAALATPPNTTDNDYEGRLRWVEDVRRTAEAKGFSFAHWLYDDSRGPLIDPGKLSLHPRLGATLGFSSPP